MAKLTLPDITNILGNPTSAQSTINANNTLIETALENTLSRDGTSPNFMGADIDMNHNDILNVNIIQSDDFIIGGETTTGVLQLAKDSADAAAASSVSAAASAVLAANEAVSAAESAAEAAASSSANAIYTFNTVALASAATIPTSVGVLRTNGYTVSGDGGGALYKVVATQPSHYGKFQDAGGRWWELAERAVVPEMLGAVGDEVADDTTPLRKWASMATSGFSLYMPGKRYKITDYIVIDGDRITLEVAALATIVQYTLNKPALVISGSRGFIHPPMVETTSRQSNTSYSSVGIMFTPRKTGSTGAYWSEIGPIYVGHFAVGVYSNPAIASTLSSSASTGSTSITVANGQTRQDGSYPWIPGEPISIRLDSGSDFVTRISSVSGTTLGLEDALPGAATSGNAVTVSVSTIFSTTFRYMKIFEASISHFLHFGQSTQFNIVEAHLHNEDAASVGNPDITDNPQTITPLYIRSANEVVILTLNVEWIRFTSAAIIINGGFNARIESLHTEGLRFGGDNIAMIAASQLNCDIESWTCDDTYAFDSEVTNIAALVRVLQSSQLTKGNIRVGSFVGRNTIAQSPSKLFWTMDSTNSGNAHVLFDRVTLMKDSALKTTGQLASPSTAPILRRFGDLIPEDCVAYRFGLSLDNTNYLDIYASLAYDYYIKEILVTNAQVSMTTAQVGIYDKNDGTGTLLTSANNLALSSLTDRDKILSLSLDSALAGRRFRGSSFPRLFLKCSATQSYGTPISVGASGTRSFSARGGSATGMMLRTINFTADHGLYLGENVIVAGAADTDYNGSVVITSIPDSKSITYYKYGTGTAETNIADTGITVTRSPAVNVLVFGKRLRS